MCIRDSISSMSEYDEFLDKTSSEINMVLALLSIFLSAFERLFFLSLIIKVFVTLAISNKSPSFNFSRLSRYLLFQLSSSSQLHFSKSLMTASASFSDTIYPVSYTHLDVYKRQILHRDYHSHIPRFNPTSSVLFDVLTIIIK